MAVYYESLCEGSAALGQPIDGVKLTRVDSHEGTTPAIGDHQARALLAAPDASTPQGLRDRAILAILLYHGLRRAELRALRLVDLHRSAAACATCTAGQQDPTRVATPRRQRRDRRLPRGGRPQR